MKNKNFNQFNDDRIAAAKKRIDDLLLLIRNWEKQKPWTALQSTIHSKINTTELLMVFDTGNSQDLKKNIVNLQKH